MSDREIDLGGGVVIAGEPTYQAMRMELKKYSMRQTKDGYVIGFVIHPSDVNLDMVNSPIGTVYNAAFVESEQP